MENQECHINKAEGEPEMLAYPSSEEMMEDVIGIKVLYNWLYQQEEENYYISAEGQGSSPEFSEDEALFVEY